MTLMPSPPPPPGTPNRAGQKGRRCRVNGKDIQIPTSVLTIAHLISSLGLVPDHLVLEYNGAVLPCDPGRRHS